MSHTVFGALGPRWELHFITAEGERHIIHTTEVQIDVRKLVETIMRQAPTRHSRGKIHG